MINTNIRILCIVSVMALLAVMYGCRDGESSKVSETTRGEAGWTEATLTPLSISENQRFADLQKAMADAIGPLQQQRLTVARQLNTANTQTPGFSPHYAPLMDRAELLRFSGDSARTAILAIVPVEERGVAHAYQQNVLYVAIMSGDRVIPVATLVGMDSAILPHGLELWESKDGDKCRLFLVSSGPVFQGSASMSLNAWEIGLHDATVARLITVSGPETILGEDSLMLDIASDKTMTITVRMGREVAGVPQSSGRESLLEIEHADGTVDVSLIGTHTAEIQMP